MEKNIGLQLLFRISVLMTFVLAIFAPFYSLYIINLGGSVELAGLSWAIFSIVSGIFMLIFRKWELKVHHKKNLYAFGYLLISLTFFLYIFISSIYVLFLAQIIFGIAIAFINPAFDTLFSKHTKRGQEITDWGGWEGATAIATGLAAIVGGFIIQNYGYSHIFMIMSLISFCLSIFIFLVPNRVL
jgi:MFS transporter, DHA1 family, multidrug resistance protein